MDISLCENIIIKLLFHKEELRDRLIPYIVPEIFDDYRNIAIVKTIKGFYEKFERVPTVAEMKLEVPDKDSYDQFLSNLDINLGEFSEEYLLHECEKFMKQKLTMNHFAECAEHLKEADFDKAQPYTDKIRESLAFSFNTALGLDFLEEEERIYNFLHNKDTIVPYGINFLDRNTKGGAHEKSLTLFIAETGLGKTLTLGSLAANAIRASKNGLYITCEMSEDKISERIIANLWDHDINDLDNINREQFHKRFAEMKNIIHGKLHVKEYPPAKITANDIRNLLKEYETKKKFMPEILYLDYLGLIRPIYTKKSDNTYTEGKRVVEEVRAVAIEYKIPALSAIQTDRQGFGAAEISLKNTADSAGYAFTADVVFGLTQSAELAEQGLYSVKILKNRYGFNGTKGRIAVNKLLMRIFDAKDDTEPELPACRRPGEPPKAAKDADVTAALDVMSDTLNKATNANNSSVFGDWE
jgi:hypothetical protein